MIPFNRVPEGDHKLARRPEWQNRGVGRSLVGAAADWLIARRAKALAVRVLDAEPESGVLREASC